MNTQRLLEWQPDAKNIRDEGKCDCCHQEGLYSYTLERYTHIHKFANGDTAEYCGYWCSECGFSNAGSRCT